LFGGRNKMNKDFYYSKENKRFKDMELKNGYPVWKDKNKKYVHKTQVEKHILRRELREGEIVHHVDNDKLNYDINNLIVLRSKEDHDKIHRNMWVDHNIMILHFTTLLFSYAVLVGTFFPKIFFLLV